MRLNNSVENSASFGNALTFSRRFTFAGKACPALLGGGIDKKDFNRCVMRAMLKALDKVQIQTHSIRPYHELQSFWIPRGSHCFDAASYDGHRPKHVCLMRGTQSARGSKHFYF